MAALNLHYSSLLCTRVKKAFICSLVIDYAIVDVCKNSQRPNLVVYIKSNTRFVFVLLFTKATYSIYTEIHPEYQQKL